MKIKNVVILSFIYLFVTSSLLIAQQTVQSDVAIEKKSTAIIEELNARTPGQGNITVYQDEAIKGILAKSAPVNLPVFSSGDGSIQYVKLRGYRIQVFSGNDQRKSKNEAYYKQRLINDSFGDMETTVFFKSPRWILRAGNYKTREEADEAMSQLKNQFPSFGKEMYIITDTVKIPL
ncbi:MAG: SPOR domain-containing protein [Dysgonamonadaceae bacterium]|nr:SPOR domain-containing protein [Dysgonamonadaceae bacterium]MDD4727900.1 SPOR domain-containing protein [Dysgonamonadaceae bacterium]